jgi:hypothetical protein
LPAEARLASSVSVCAGALVETLARLLSFGGFS